MGFGKVVSGRNQCLSIHLAAGGAHGDQERPVSKAAMNAAWAVRWEQRLQAEECRMAIGPPIGK